MKAADADHPSTADTLLRGAAGRCPRCGKGRLLHRYLKLVDRCSMCDEPYGHYRADDAPAWLTILIVGHITAPVMVALAYLQMEVWIEQVIFVPAIVLLTLILLPICKGVILALLWTTKAEGSEKI